MPQFVRNFWIELSVDGKKTRVATGPRAKNGGFELAIRMRESGDIVTPVRIAGITHFDNSLELVIYHGSSLRRSDEQTLHVVTRR